MNTPSGQSSLNLDAGSIQTLLSVLAPQATFEGGKLAMQSGDLKLSLNPVVLQSQDLSLLLARGTTRVTLAVDQLSLNQDGLKLQFQLRK